MKNVEGVVSQNTETLILSKEIYDFYDRKNEWMLEDRKRDIDDFEYDEQDDIGKLFVGAPEAGVRLAAHLAVLLASTPWEPEATDRTLQVDERSLHGFQMGEVATRTVDRLLREEGIDPAKIIGWETCVSNADADRKFLLKPAA